jgi:hypothetical protein
VKGKFAEKVDENHLFLFIFLQNVVYLLEADTMFASDKFREISSESLFKSRQNIGRWEP